MRGWNRFLEHALYTEVILNDVYGLATLEPGHIVIDIGAHIGFFSVLAGVLVGPYGHVYSYEPAPEFSRRLRFNVALNGLSNVISTFELAVAGKEGERDLFGASLYEKPGWRQYLTGYIDTSGPIRVKTTTLAQILEDNKVQCCDFLKMDCEGAEWEILFSSADALKNVKRIGLEVHLESDERKTYQDMMAFLEDQGFTCSLTASTLSELGIIRAQRIGRGCDDGDPW